jgi:outer membrane lipoprotein-sorting protein
LKRQIVVLLLALALGVVETVAVFGQDILTADKYFDKISQNYAKVQDYEADITITQGDSVMKGTIDYKKPDLIRIDFSDPKDQVIVSDGTTLTIYIPKQSAVFQQSLKQGTTAGGPAIANAEGLDLLKKSYSIAYLENPTPVPLDKNSSEKVVKLKLEWRSTGEGFRQLELDIGDQSGLIRRIVGVSASYEKTQFDFTNIKTNQNIPAGRFKYDPPQTANIYPNFLFVPQS